MKSSRALPLTGAILLILLAALLYPGMLNMDSAAMLEQAKTGSYNDWHSPAVSMFWGLLDHIWSGPPSLLIFGLGLFVAGACWFVGNVTDNKAGRLAALLLLCLWPPILNDLALVGKDQAFIACLMAAIALIWRAKSDGRLPPALLGLLALLIFAACAIRPDSAIALTPSLILLYRLPLGNRSKSFGWMAAGGVAMLSVVIGLGLTVLFNRLVARAYVTFPLQTTLVHDLAGISARTDLYLMPPYVDPALDLSMLKGRYTPVSGDPVLFDMHNPIVKIVAAQADVRALESTWFSAVTRHPWAYLQHRAATLIALLGIDEPQPYQLYQPNTDEFGAHWHHLSAADHIKNPHNAVLNFYRGAIMPALLNTPAFRGFSYDIVLLGLMLAALIRRRGPRDAVILALGLGALLHQAALLMVSPAALFRYLYPSVLITLATLILTLSDPRNVPGQPPRLRLRFSLPNISRRKEN